MRRRAALLGWPSAFNNPGRSVNISDNIGTGRPRRLPPKKKPSRQSVRGLDGLVVGAPPFGVPRGSGLSSSSALTVVAAVALARANDWSPIFSARYVEKPQPAGEVLVRQGQETARKGPTIPSFFNFQEKSIPAGAQGDPHALRLCWLYPLRDLMGFITWMGSYFGGSSFHWRGDLYHFTPGGRIVNVARASHAQPS